MRAAARTDVEEMGIAPWGVTHYSQALSELSTEMGLTLAEFARRFGTVTLPVNDLDGLAIPSVAGFCECQAVSLGVEGGTASSLPVRQ